MALLYARLPGTSRRPTCHALGVVKGQHGVSTLDDVYSARFWTLTDPDASRVLPTSFVSSVARILQLGYFAGSFYIPAVVARLDSLL